MPRAGLPHPPPAIALRWSAANATDAARSALRHADAAFRRFGLGLALELEIELALGPGSSLPTADSAVPAPVIGLRVPLDDLAFDPPHDQPARRMAQLRSLHASRLVYALPPDSPDLGDPAAARELGRRLDGIAARFQGQGFRLGLALEPGHVAERMPSLVALATQITLPSFFLALAGVDLPRFLDDGWGRALAPLVGQVCWSIAPRSCDARAAGAAASARLGDLTGLDTLVLVPEVPAVPERCAGEARSGGPEPRIAATLEAQLESALEELAKNSFGGLSRASALP